MHLCVLSGSRNKQRLFLYTAVTYRFLKPKQSVFCAVRTGSLNQADTVSYLIEIFFSCAGTGPCTVSMVRKIFPTECLRGYMVSEAILNWNETWVLVSDERRSCIHERTGTL